MYVTKIIENRAKVRLSAVGSLFSDSLLGTSRNLRFRVSFIPLEILPSRSIPVLSKSLIFGLLFITFTLSSCSALQKTADERANWTAQKFYAEAKTALNDAKYESAIKLYEQLEARYPYGKFAVQAQLEVGYAYYKADQRELGLAAVNRFLRLHPTHKNAAYAQYLKGLISFTEDRTFLGKFAGNADLSDRDPSAARQAYEAFKRLVERYPQSPYSEDARKRMGYLLNAQARHEVIVARFYLKRQAYVAAVNRSKTIINQFSQTPAVEDALSIMIKAYQKMGLSDLAKDARRVLKKNFPQSRYLVTSS